MRLYPEHFSAQDSPARARELFKASVTSVEVEVSSYCNRACPYCPNAVADRRSQPRTMDAALFASILGQLRAIGYAGAVSLHRYNEPLADRPYILSCVRRVRDALPRAQIRIFTNGDYLDRSYVEELYAAGCRFLRASLHATGGDWDDDAMADALGRRLSRLGFPFALHRAKGKAVAKVEAAPDLAFDYSTLDYLGREEGAPVTRALNRGGALAVNAGYRRTAPCFSPFTELQVEWDGSLQACCNLRSDVPGQEIHTIGRLEPATDLMAVWAGAGYAAWRRALANWQPKAGPCASCHYGEVRDTAQLRAALDQCRAWFAKE